MPEGQSHKRAKSKAAGKSGHTEVKIKGGRRLDAMTRRRAVEVETSGAPGRLTQAARRLKASGKAHHTLVVPQRDFPKARQAMRDAKVSGTVRNLTGTKSSHVSASKRTTKTGASRKK